MAGGLLGIATSGLMAFQRSLDTTGHNIANVNTEGYSRQRVELSTRPEQFTGAGFVGQGVNIANISRSYDQFITNQLRSSTSAFGDVDQYHKLAAQIDNLLADPATGMAPAIKDFFNAVNELADDPSTIPARQVMLSEAEILTQRFNTMNERFATLRSQVNSDVTVMVDNINSIASELADLNVRIATELGRSGGMRQPNDLLDKRDTLLAKLAESVDISVLPQKNGMVSVFMGQGQALVLDANASKLTVGADEFDTTHLTINIGSDLDITRFITGGSLAGALRFRDEILDPAQQKLGQVAAGLAMEFDALQTRGYDLNGNLGQDLFGFGGTEIPTIASPKNSPLSTAALTAEFQDPGNLATADAAKNLDFSDFQLTFDGTDYTLTRLRDRQSYKLTAVAVAVPPSTSLVYPPPPATKSGLPGINITFTGAMATNDTFLIRPTYSAAKNIGVKIADPRQLAAATNIEVDPRTGKPVQKLDASGSPVVDAFGNPVYVTVAGPMPSDNRNALQMADLETKLGMLGGKATFQDTYGQLVSSVGTMTHAAEVSASAQEVLLNQAKESRENLAGVNLDEEAANLIKFQQSYQAAAQVVSITNTLFDALIGAVR